MRLETRQGQSPITGSGWMNNQPKRSDFIFSNIPQLIEKQSEKYGSKIALETKFGEAVTYEELNSYAKRIAKLILDSSPVKNNPRVGIVLPNGADMALTLLGAIEVGIAMPLNPAYQREEFETYLRELNPDIVIVDEKISPQFTDAAKKLSLKTLDINSGWRSKVGVIGDLEDWDDAREIDPNNVALILMTSGSTGKSKRVPLTHKNICVSIADICYTTKLSDTDVCLCMWEQFHIGGLVDLLLVPIASGGKVVCASGFNVDDFFSLLFNAKPTWFQGVPTTLIEIVSVGTKQNFNLDNTSLRFIRAVASALPETLQTKIESLFGIPVIQTFGMTEASPLITTNRLPPDERKLGSVGKSCGPEIAIMDEDGKILECDEIGEIVIKGENVFKGYEGNDKENEHVFRYGWFHTGDKGNLDRDGYLFLRGRIKEQINRGGEKISPQEIDDVLMRHESIQNAASFSVPHPTLGEDVGVAIVCKNSGIKSHEVQEYLSKYLANFKIPKTIVFLDKLPINAIGKVKRDTLSSLAANLKSNKEISKPKNELEELLLKIWQNELEEKNIGVHDDFISIGGDSLSSLRILASIEKILGIKLPEKDIAEFNTIESIANYVSRNRLIDDARLRKIKATDEEIKSVFSSFSIKDYVYLSPNSFITSSEFEIQKEGILNVLTPQEVLHFVDYIDANISEQMKSDGTEKIDINHYTEWSKNVRNTILNSNYDLGWERHSVSENVFLYKTSKRVSKNLIVGFCGNQMRLMMPTYQFLGDLDSNVADMILIRDTRRLHYVKGVIGIANDIPSLCQWLKDYCAENGYSNVISFGTSSGGLMAITSALTNQWKKAIAICPESPHNQEELKKYLSKFDHNPQENNTSTTSVEVCFGNLKERDVNSANDLKQLLPFVNLHPDPECSTHILLFDILLRGQLKNFFTEMIAYE